MALVLDKYLNDIHSACTLHNVDKLYVFGSAVTDLFNNKSDIDLLVNFKSTDIENYADNYYHLKLELQKILNRPIDLLELHAIKNPYFKSEIENRKLLIYG